jgi:hypothetical protein
MANDTTYPAVSSGPSAEDVTGLHRRFDKLESNFSGVQAEQHKMALSLVTLDKRIDLVELQITAAQQRETLVMNALNQRLEQNSAMIKRLFEKFETAADKAGEDRRKIMFWLLTTAVSVLSSIGFIMFNKVFAG